MSPLFGQTCNLVPERNAVLEPKRTSLYHRPQRRLGRDRSEYVELTHATNSRGTPANTDTTSCTCR
jgi:hypothetical protein